MGKTLKPIYKRDYVSLLKVIFSVGCFLSFFFFISELYLGREHLISFISFTFTCALTYFILHALKVGGQARYYIFPHEVIIWKFDQKEFFSAMGQPVTAGFDKYDQIKIEKKYANFLAIIESSTDPYLRVGAMFRKQDQLLKFFKEIQPHIKHAKISDDEGLINID